MVEDEPVIALDMQKALRDGGAMVVAAGMVESGLFATEHPELSGAVIDLRLGADGVPPPEATGRALRRLYGLPAAAGQG